MQVSVIYGACRRHDAISEAVRGTVQAISGRRSWSCRLFAYACDFSELHSKTVSGMSDVILDNYFITSDVIIYHFGIYYELFNIANIGNGRARQIVRYHNVTPKIFMPRDMHALLDRSEEQKANMLNVERIWADSQFNKNDLVQYGIPENRIEILPLYIKEYYKGFTRGKKARDVVRILYVGRFVASKGVTDLLRAIALTRKATSAPFLVDLVGNESFSDPSYIAEVRHLIRSLDIADAVTISGEVSDADLRIRLARSHIFAIASYHEGFCVPLLEAMQAKCIPIAYAAGNVPDLVGPFGALVEPGDWRSFADELTRLIAFFAAHNRGKKTAHLPLRTGPARIEAYDRQLDKYLQSYTYQAFRQRTISALSSPRQAGREGL